MIPGALRRARNKAFHYESAYLPADSRPLKMERGAQHWAKHLLGAFVLFFAASFQGQAQPS